MFVLGLQNASNKLKRFYVKELIKCMVDRPLSSTEEDNQSVLREDIFIDLVVLPTTTVEEIWNNSDRESLMKQQHLEKTFTEQSVDKIFMPNDEVVFVRGVAGIGKSTLIEMFTFKWAKNELKNDSKFDFVFKFTCREINTVLKEFSTLKELFELKFSEVFSSISFDELNEVSDNVLIIVDGLDELKDIYQMDGENKNAQDPDHLRIIFNLMIPKFSFLQNQKSIICGRPKALEFVKKQLHTRCKIKTIGPAMSSIFPCLESPFFVKND